MLESLDSIRFGYHCSTLKPKANRNTNEEQSPQTFVSFNKNQFKSYRIQKKLSFNDITN